MMDNFSKEEVQEIKRWADEHILGVLASLEIKVADRGRYLMGRCPIPCHPGDGTNPRAFVWSTDKSSWCCFTHQCHADSGTDVIGLVMAVKEKAFPHAVEYLFDLKNNGTKEFMSYPIISNGTRNVVDNRSIDPKKLSILYPDSYFLSRGVSKNILDLHKVGYWQKKDTFMDKRAIVPIFDMNSNLVGFSGRDVNNNPDMAKWVHGKDFVTKKAGIFNKSSVLYNLNNAKTIAQKTKKVYIVEGPMDVWKLQEAGIKNVVATLGLGISFQQQELLISLGIEEVVICYDNDKDSKRNAGANAAAKIKEQIGHLFKVTIKLPTLGKDYGELSVEEVVKELL